MTFLWKAAGAPEPETTSCPFTDVPKTKYYYKPILWAVENGITGGVSSTKFGVGKACTREQIVTFLWKFAGAPEPLSDSCPFSDVPKTKYFYKPVLWAYLWRLRQELRPRECLRDARRTTEARGKTPAERGRRRGKAQGQGSQGKGTLEVIKELFP